MTDVLSRRLGQGYLKVLEVFQGASSNLLHKEMLDDILKPSSANSGNSMGIVTTNFDTCLDEDLERRAREKEIHLCKLTGNMQDDLESLEEVMTTLNDAKTSKNSDSTVQPSQDQAEKEASTPVEEQEGKSVRGNTDKFAVLLCQSFKSFDLIASMMYLILDAHSDFRFVFNIHGTANNTVSCVDSNFQREQRLPYGVSLTLRSLYSRCCFTVVGYSGKSNAHHCRTLRHHNHLRDSLLGPGLDMNEDLDYLLMLSSWQYIDAVWLCRPSRSSFAVEGMPDERINTPPAMLKEELKSKAISITNAERSSNAQEGTYVDNPSFTFSIADIVLPKDLSSERGKKVYKNSEGSFASQLDIAVANACSYEPAWAALALQDVIRALLRELRRNVLREQRAEWRKQNQTQVLIDRDERLSDVERDLSSLQEKLSSRLEALTKRSDFHDACCSSTELRNAWTEGWLMKNMRRPKSHPQLPALIRSLIQLFRRVQRGLEPLEDQRRRLKEMAEFIETWPEEMPDAWVVWATYIMLNYHDENRRELCWAYYTKAVRSTLRTGNVWGRLALDQLRREVWIGLNWNNYQARDNRTSLQFHKRCPVKHSDKIHKVKVNCIKNSIKLVLPELSFQPSTKLISLVHVLGIDPELPVHNHAGIPLGEYYRVALILALLFSRRVLIRETAGRGNRVFLEETLKDAEGRLDLFPKSRHERKYSQDNSPTPDGSMSKSQIDSENSLNAIVSCINWVQEDNEADVEEFRDPKEAVTKNITRASNSTNRQIPAVKTSLLFQAMGDLISNLNADTVTNILSDLFTYTYPSSGRKLTKEKNREYIKETRKFLKILLTNFQECQESLKLTWSRDMLFEVFDLSSKAVLGTNARSALAKNGLNVWISEVFKRYPWRYLDTLQLLISAPFALNRALLRKEPVLVLDAYERSLYCLGLVAFYPLEQRTKLRLVMHELEGEWKDYQCFSLADIAKIRIDMPKEEYVGTQGVMSVLKTRQLSSDHIDKENGHLSPGTVGANRAEKEDLAINPESHAKPSPLYTSRHGMQNWVQVRKATVNRLLDEFVICSNEALPTVYDTPRLDACLFNIVI